MKSFAPKPWVVPMPVLIIGTYNEDGTPNAMNAAWSGQWDMKEIMISMGSHVTTKNLDRNGEFTVAFATKNTMVASDFVGDVQHAGFLLVHLCDFLSVLEIQVLAGHHAHPLSWEKIKPEGLFHPSGFTIAFARFW